MWNGNVIGTSPNAIGSLSFEWVGFFLSYFQTSLMNRCTKGISRQHESLQLNSIIDLLWRQSECLMISLALLIIAITESRKPGREEPLAVTASKAKQQRPHYVSIPSTKVF